MKHFRMTAGSALVATAVLSISMTGCGGGGGGDSPVATSATVTVSPSLGKFSAGAHVTIKKTDGTSIATADTTSAGTAIVNIGTYTGPLVIEVTGDTGVTYYDEGATTTDKNKPFGATEVLRAIAPAVQSNVGVTPATHAAVEAIKAANSNAIPQAITVSTIDDANAKIATALGISNVLQAPKLVDASTGSTLDLANVADKYALQLAALAKLATSGKTALDVAKDLASDLSDGKLDGKYTPLSGTVVPNTSTTYTAASVNDDLSANVKSASDVLGTTETKTLVNNDSSVVGTVTTDVTAVVAPSPAVVLSKAMFAELRSTLSSFSNSSKTGFLDTQALRASDDMKLVVAPASDKLAVRLETIGMAIQTYDNAQLSNPASAGLKSEPVNISDNVLASAWTTQRGTLADVVARVGSTYFCFTANPATAASPVTCYMAGADALNANGRIRFMKYVLTPSATVSRQFSYTAVRENRTWNQVDGIGAAETPSPAIPGGAGTVTKNGTTSFVLAGTLPPSATSPTGVFITGADTLSVSVVKTALSATSNFHYAMSGSVSTTSTAATPKPVTLSLESGSYFDTDETNAGTSNGIKMVGINLVGTVKTDVTKFTGTVAISGITGDKYGTNQLASSLVFTGSISDISTSGAGEYLTGKLQAGVTDYASYDPQAALSSTNYIHSTAAFTGTVQAPSRPLLKLVLSGTSTGPTSRSATLNYSYGTVSITGSGTSTDTTSSFSISNQDGIQIAANPTKPDENLITKAGVTLATFVKGVISYVDGTRETFN